MNTSVQTAGEAPDDFDDGPQVGLVDLLTWVGERKRFIGGVTAAAAAVSVAAALAMPNVFTARTTLLPPSNQQQSGSAAALAALGSLGSLAGGLSAKTPDELYLSLLRSDTVQRSLDKRFDLKARYNAKTYEALRGALPKFIRVAAEKKSGVITVEVDDEDPKFAAELANAHASEITGLLGRLAVTEAQQRRVFFEQQLKESKENLIKSEVALREVQEKSGMVVLDKQAGAIIEAVAALKTRIAEREIRLKVMRTATTAENPDVRLLMSEIAALRSELQRMESNGTTVSTSKEGGIDIPIGRLPSAGLEYVRAYREMKFQETLLASMLRQFEVAKLDEAKDAPALQQVDVALPPDRKSKPGRAVIVLASTFAALLLSSLWVIWRRYGQLAREHDPERAKALDGLRSAWRLRR
ncbi:Wzz/FepE/Etk N-terminal domain-containing protein [Rhizobacter sp. Root1221]|uniref:Wzz/FepE/Etk N-terminal domain-containing protein n=1 Tax=Rhizobacter sp. Root1221 TaxID=1736433 RepID=UPI0006F3D3E8|nr:Wzz/FepE/Etk N-terminal domain-containing protein [Rhizobacter sp. Root1221]KQV99730.1 hypothetical protein ASC87_03285 [Rhizobacter sp. Root1221]